MASYTAAENITTGVTCELCEGEGKYVADKWASLFNPMKRVHKSTMKDFFQKEVNKELASTEKARYNSGKKKQKLIEEESAAASPPPPPPVVAEAQPCWKQMTVWVKCGADGQPLRPLECTLKDPTKAAVTEAVSVDPLTALNEKMDLLISSSKALEVDLPDVTPKTLVFEWRRRS
eukprot:5931637-Amphidinium_carterae.1